TVEAGTALAAPLQAQVRDEFDNPVIGLSVAWAIAAGGGSLSAAASTTDSTGVAYMNWTIGQTIGAQPKVTASAAGLVLEFTAVAKGAHPAQLMLLTPASGASSGSAFAAQPSVRVADIYGNKAASVSSVTVRLRVSPGAIVIRDSVKSSTTTDLQYE